MNRVGSDFSELLRLLIVLVMVKIMLSERIYYLLDVSLYN